MKLSTFVVLDMCSEPKRYSERQNLLGVARTAKSRSKHKKLLKSCQAQSGKA